MAVSVAIVTKRRALLKYLQRIGPDDTWFGLVEFLSDRANENTRDLASVGDEALRRYIGVWVSYGRFGTDPARRGEWVKAVQAVRRYHERYPNLRIGQIIANLTARYWLEGLPNNLDLVRLVNWELDGANPHIGRPVVVRRSNGSWLLCTLIGQTRVGDNFAYVLESNYQRYVFRLDDDLHRLLRGSELRIIASDLPEDHFRRLLAENYEPELEHQVLVALVDQAIMEAARGDQLLAGYFTYQLTGAWPNS